MGEKENDPWAKVLSLASPETKKGLQALIALIILIFSLLFVNIFIISVNILKGVFGWDLLLYPLTPILMYIIIVVLFSSDILYNGDPNENSYVRAFQSSWPSKYIAQKFKITEKEAMHYWFENFFNTWRNPNYPRHDQWERTLKRGYSCRFIYYFIKFLDILIILSLFLLFLIEGMPRIFPDFKLTSETNVWIKIGFIVFIFFVDLYIRLSNKTSPNHMTGVWKKYEEINEMHMRWINDNILTIEDLRNGIRR